MKRLHTSILALIAASSMLTGCARKAAPTAPVATLTPEPTVEATATPEASATPEATAEASATPEATTEATPEATVTPEATPSAAPEATVTPSATPEAEAPVEDATAASKEETATVTNDSGDDCGWVTDWNMADGGYCSLHPDWYGMPANNSGNSCSNASASQAQPAQSYGTITFYNQLDGRWRNQQVGDATFGPHGCCPTALAMMLSRRGIYMTPPDVGWMLNSWGIFGNWANGYLGTRSDAWEQVADHYGWAWSLLYTGDDLYNALAAGADVGLALNLGYAGHTVYVHGVDAYGNTTVYDGNSSGPYKKSVYTLMSQVYDPYSVDGAAVAIYDYAATNGDSPVADVTADDDLAAADPGTIVCYNEDGEQIACDF